MRQQRLSTKTTYCSGKNTFHYRTQRTEPQDSEGWASAPLLPVWSWRSQFISQASNPTIRWSQHVYFPGEEYGGLIFVGLEYERERLSSFSLSSGRDLKVFKFRDTEHNRIFWGLLWKQYGERLRQEVSRTVTQEMRDGAQEPFLRQANQQQKPRVRGLGNPPTMSPPYSCLCSIYEERSA